MINAFKNTVMFLCLYALFNGIRFGVSKIITPGPPFGFISVSILLGIFAILPLLLYLLYTRSLSKKYSVGLIIISGISLLLSLYLILYAISVSSHLKEVGIDASEQNHLTRQTIMDEAMFHVNIIYVLFLGIAALSIPIIDWFTGNKQLSRPSPIMSIITSIGIHVLLFLWMYVTIFFIGIGLILTTW